MTTDLLPTWRVGFSSISFFHPYTLLLNQVHNLGRSYSASLKYRQACRSVIFIHKLQYIQHHHYLLSSSGPHQNYVEVERDWSDLSDKLQNLLDDSLKAERVANNSVNVFHHYLSPAANSCYWRMLLHHWAKVSTNITTTLTDPLSRGGVRFETFLLLDQQSMMRFPL